MKAITCSPVLVSPLTPLSLPVAVQREDISAMYMLKPQTPLGLAREPLAVTFCNSWPVLYLFNALKIFCSTVWMLSDCSISLRFFKMTHQRFVSISSLYSEMLFYEHVVFFDKGKIFDFCTTSHLKSCKFRPLFLKMYTKWNTAKRKSPIGI